MKTEINPSPTPDSKPPESQPAGKPVTPALPVAPVPGSPEAAPIDPVPVKPLPVVFGPSLDSASQVLILKAGPAYGAPAQTDVRLVASEHR